ncbi:uncharacterized protein LOC141907616 [Tubulanus polymorphus]|uniref:uncharacterized protein LOC141907616 n=1 Tax=Tubulanus polymorphus TaxID=672921 RepID=UPI003DA65BE2
MSTECEPFREISSQTKQLIMKECGVQVCIKDGGLSIRSVQSDNKKFHYYTGLQTYQNFKMIFATFRTDICDMQYYFSATPKMDLEDQFFLTLIKLRLNRPNIELSDLFQISEMQVANIFVTWINFLYFHFKDLCWWPSKELVKYFSPSDFGKKFPSTRVIVDGTEIPLKKPKNPVMQQASYSTYKNRNTVKALIGISPGGLVSYVSDIYCGSTSDRQICERSRLQQMLDPNDSIMADKGFNVQDLFIPYNVEINIPEFFKKKNRMSEKSVQADRKIASKRVHVERVIGLAKTFKILSQPLNTNDARLADAIVTSCFFLCNFRSCIIPPDA